MKSALFGIYYAMCREKAKICIRKITLKGWCLSWPS